MFWLRQNKSEILYLLAAIVLSLPAIFSLLIPGFFETDDGEHMVIRFSAFHEVLRDGQFPVRYLSRLNHDYGYPVANFLYPGYMYLAEPIKILGFNFVDTIKIIFGLSLFSSLIFTYLWLSKFFDKWSSFVGGFFYLYVPYHLFDIYKRGSVGEILALAVVPFILWQIEKGSFFLSTIGISFLILSHNTLAVIFLPIIVFYLALNIFIVKKKNSLTYQYTSILVLGLGLSAFFFLPAIFDLQYTIFSRTQVADWSKYFASVDLIGVSVLAVFVLTFIFLLIGKIKWQKHRLTILMFLIGLVAIFLSTQFSSFIWSFLPASFVQFPFRMLSVVILCSAFLASVCISVFSKKVKIFVGAAFIMLSFISSLPFIKPSVFFNKGDSYYSTNQATTTVQNEYMPNWVRVFPTQRSSEKIINSGALLSGVVFKPNYVSFTSKADLPTVATIERIYFPGWKAKLDGEDIPIIYNNERGVMRLDIPSGKHTAYIYFGETNYRLFADMISIVSFFIILMISKRRLGLRQ